MATGLRVAPEGTDAFRAEKKDLSYTTEAQSLKLREFGTVTLNVDSGATSLTVTVTHGLGYVPTYRVYFEATPGSGKFHPDSHKPDNLDPAESATCLAQITSATLQLIFIAAPLAGRYRVRYYIFEDRVI